MNRTACPIAHHVTGTVPDGCLPQALALPGPQKDGVERLTTAGGCGGAPLLDPPPPPPGLHRICSQFRREEIGANSWSTDVWAPVAPPPPSPSMALTIARALKWTARGLADLHNFHSFCDRKRGSAAPLFSPKSRALAGGGISTAPPPHPPHRNPRQTHKGRIGGHRAIPLPGARREGCAMAERRPPPSPPPPPALRPEYKAVNGGRPAPLTSDLPAPSLTRVWPNARDVAERAQRLQTHPRDQGCVRTATHRRRRGGTRPPRPPSSPSNV